MTISPADEAFYQELLDFTYDLAEKASKVILDGLNARWHHNAIAEEKKNTVDLVTETDQAVEKLIKEAIFAKYPSHKFIGEESYAAGERQELTDEYTWMVDPIDGTMNFVHSHPSFACSIGIAHKSIPVVGVIAQPKLGRIFSARLGGGAYMNKEHKLPLTGGIPQPLTSLRDCMVAAEWGSDRSSETIPAKVNSFMKLAGDGSRGIDGGIMVHALRTTGSSACNLVAVAAGELDIYWDNGCWPWDICAGAIIIREAGGYFTGSKRDHKEGRADGEYLMNRRYACIRPIAGKSARDIEDQQKKLISDLYDTVQEWTLTDMS